MKLYQPKLIIILVFFLSACTSISVPPEDMTIVVRHDGLMEELSIPSGSTSREAIESIGIEISNLDYSEPPLFTILSPEQEVKFIKVTEEFEIEEIVVPYETQILRNESLSEGERRLIEPGINGIQEITVRITYENGIEILRNEVKNLILQRPTAEIVMIGTQGTFGSIPINGNIVYILAGNAWIMEEDTGIRRPIVTSGDLDGRIFSLSPDGRWLLYTRAKDEEDTFNALWVTRIEGTADEEILSIDLKANNIPHFADWVPDSVNGIVFSDAEKILSAPGWEANNNLIFINFSTSGWVSNKRTAIDENSGGIYGWWGTNFSWSPDGEILAYSRPDGIGVVNFDTENLEPLYDITPLQTGSGWAWSAEISWTNDGEFILFADNKTEVNIIGNNNTKFDFTAFNLETNKSIVIEQNVGMFSYGVPINTDGETEQTFIAYLQALVPEKSDNSGYRLGLMDIDGSNNRLLFPSAGSIGISPHTFVVEPNIENVDKIDRFIAIIHLGNLWLVDIESGVLQQLTGDGSVIALDWK